MVDLLEAVPVDPEPVDVGLVVQLLPDQEVENPQLSKAAVANQVVLPLAEIPVEALASKALVALIPPPLVEIPLVEIPLEEIPLVEREETMAPTTSIPKRAPTPTSPVLISASELIPPSSQLQISRKYEIYL